MRPTWNLKFFWKLCKRKEIVCQKLKHWSTNSKRAKQGAKLGTWHSSHDSWVSSSEIHLSHSLSRVLSCIGSLQQLHCAPHNTCIPKSLTAQTRENRSGVQWFFFCCLESQVIHRGQVRFTHWVQANLFPKVTRLDITSAKKHKRYCKELKQLFTRTIPLAESERSSFSHRK